MTDPEKKPLPDVWLQEAEILAGIPGWQLQACVSSEDAEYTNRELANPVRNDYFRRYVPYDRVERLLEAVRGIMWRWQDEEDGEPFDVGQDVAALRAALAEWEDSRGEE